MGILILLLFIGLIFPVLWLPLLLFGSLFLIFIPLKFTFDSIFNIFTVPSQIYKIATNPDLRKNHALEHATVNVLEKKSGYNRLAGYATDNGFYIMGVDSPFAVKNAAQKGLELMKNGKSQIAIHRNCGTSLIVANFTSAIIFLILLLYTGYFSIISMLIAILLAHLIGPHLGKLVQQHFTTTPDVNEMEIESAQFENQNSWNRPAKIFVKTSKIPYIK